MSEKANYNPHGSPYKFGVFGPFRPVDLKIESIEGGLQTQITITAVAGSFIDDPKVWESLRELMCQPATKEDHFEPPMF